MLPRPLASLLLGLLLLTVLAPQMACTALGAFVGNRIDSRGAHRRVIPVARAITVPRGKRLIVVLRDGQRVQGAYRDTTTLGDSAYAALWRRWQARAPRVESAVPGDEVTVVQDSSEWRGSFTGYHYRAVLVAPLEGGASRRLPMASLRSLQGPDDQQWTGDSLAALDASGALPSRMALTLRSDKRGRDITQLPPSDHLVPISEIRTVSLEQGHAARNVCAFIGLAGDMVVLAGLAFAASYGEWGSQGCSGDFTLLSGPASLPPGVHLTAQPYDRLAGALVQGARLRTDPRARSVTSQTFTPSLSRLRAMTRRWISEVPS